MDAEDWLYGDGEHEAAGGFKKRLAELRAVGDPIARRASELKARPEVCARPGGAACFRRVFAPPTLHPLLAAPSFPPPFFALRRIPTN